MTRARWVVRGITVAALVYAVGVAALASIPAWQWLPEDRVLGVASASCPTAAIYVRGAQREPLVAEELLPVVMAGDGHRGGETALSRASCAMMTGEARSRAGFLRFVPERFICSSIRRHVRDTYVAAHRSLGPPLLIEDGEALGGFAYYDALTRRGLQLRRGHLNVELAPVE